ncbi:MAG: amidohydrolase family protein, partial [Leptospiraceae bacterium]|nr:amidohydrolase family protein [Leptospiraceae bacterium]
MSEVIIINNGLLFDGTQQKASVRHIQIADGIIQRISNTPIPNPGGARMVDAAGKWITPGFIDIHTHYDAEVEVMPELPESLRHGVTTIFMGSCSLSAALGSPEDVTDMFTRVEAIPYDSLLPLMKEKKSWNTLREYRDHFEQLPLGVNVASYIGYSAVRSHVMGFEASLTRQKPTDEQMTEILRLIQEGIDLGYLGLSINTNFWDKVGGNRYRSHLLPSSYASWGELFQCIRLVARNNSSLQCIPNISTKYEVFVYLALSMIRKLRISLVSLMDIRSNRSIYRVLPLLSRMANAIRGKFRYQALPELFDVWSDGIDLVVFEEFGAGSRALDYEDEVEERKKLINSSKYRKWFKRQWRNPLLPKVFHRNFALATVVDCPDKTLIGKNFAEIAKQKGKSTEDAFLDLVSQYDKSIRWRTEVGNDRLKPLQRIVSSDQVLLGFSDAGAHLRNMAHYNFPLRMLKLVQDSHNAGAPIMSMEKAVWRLTKELADWHGIQAGHIYEGARA